MEGTGQLLPSIILFIFNLDQFTKYDPWQGSAIACIRRGNTQPQTVVVKPTLLPVEISLK